MTKPLTANAAQCRKALLTLTTDKIRASAKSLGWALLSTLQAEGVRFSGRAIVEEALDWDATLLMQRYCEASKEARQMGRKIANHVVFTATGIDRDATTAAKPAKAA